MVGTKKREEDKFEEKLVVGSIVEARFTNNFHFIRFKGEISKINKESFRIKSLEVGVNGWGLGHEFVLPRRCNPRFSSNNGVFVNE